MDAKTKERIGLTADVASLGQLAWGLLPIVAGLLPTAGGMSYLFSL